MRDWAIHLEELMWVNGFFGQSLDAIQAKFELGKKQDEALTQHNGIAQMWC